MRLVVYASLPFLPEDSLPANSGYTLDQSKSSSIGSNAEIAKIIASTTKPNVNITPPVKGPILKCMILNKAPSNYYRCS